MSTAERSCNTCVRRSNTPAEEPCATCLTFKHHLHWEPAAIPAATPTNVDSVLTERGQRYGIFSKHASVTQDIKRAMFNCRGRDSLAADQVEALEMIAHKIGRIVNGDPDYADSWVDIAGYAKLVADRLEGVAR